MVSRIRSHERRWRWSRVVAGGTAVTAALTVALLGLSQSATAMRAHSSAPIQLKFMSLANSPGVESAWAGLIKAFEKQNPGITITRAPVAYANYRTQVKLQASAPSPPDLVEGDMGPGGVMASLATAGLLRSLDSYAKKYHWSAKYGPFIRQLELSGGGKIVGNGPVYGVPDFAEILGVFYNKKLLSRLHLRVPATFAQFEASLAAAKKAGITPDSIGGSDQFPWSHLFDILADHFGQPSKLIKWFDGSPSATIVSPALMKAGKLEQQWYSDGYFEDGANGVSDAQAVAMFEHGQSLYKVDGPWATQGNLQAMGSNVGFFLLPPSKTGSLPPSTGWMGWTVGVTAKSAHPDAAAAFVNFLTTPAARAIFLQHDNPPGTPGKLASSSPIVQDVAKAFDAEIGKGTLVPYMDVAYPEADPYNQLANAQAMAAGKMSVSQFLTLTQKGWAKYHGYK
jgi:raffinose/stachyose/melibiose transport system substrate-binding protein